MISDRVAFVYKKVGVTLLVVACFFGIAVVFTNPFVFLYMFPIIAMASNINPRIGYYDQENQRKYTKILRAMGGCFFIFLNLMIIWILVDSKNSTNLIISGLITTYYSNSFIASDWIRSRANVKFMRMWLAFAVICIAVSYLLVQNPTFLAGTQVLTAFLLHDRKKKFV